MPAVLGVGYTIRHGFEIVLLKMYDKICLIEFLLMVQIMEDKEITRPSQPLFICRKHNIQ